MTNQSKNIVIYPTNDWIFKRVYGRKGSENITEKFINTFLNLDIKVRDLNEQKNLETDIIDEKAGIIDVFVETHDGTQIDVEMQVGNYEDLEVRLTKYACQLFANSLKKGSSYDSCKKTIVMALIKDDIDKYSNLENYRLRWNLREEMSHNILLTDKFEIVIIRLAKINELIHNKKMKGNEKIALWTKFLFNPKDLKEEDMKENPEIKEAVEIYNDVTSDMGEINAAIRRDMFLSDIASGKKRAVEEGMKKVAKKLLDRGMSIDDIVEITGLTKEEIESLK